MEETVVEPNRKNWHDRYYKILILIPLLIIIFSIVYIFSFYQNTGDFLKNDISLTGGSSITVYDKNISAEMIENDLSGMLPDLSVRGIYEFGTSTQRALVFETTAEWNYAKGVLEDYFGYSLTEGENADVEFTGSSLSESFYSQLLIAVLVAFVFMSIVVFIIFRTFIPSMTVIFCAFVNILMTLTVVNIMGMSVSTAGIVAFLTLIGYSVDTDILLTTRLLKRSEGTLNERIFGAFKTGITMTLTSLFAVLASLIIIKSFSETLSQIFTILAIGLFFDMLNTWITNVSILKFYIKRKNSREEKQ